MPKASPVHARHPKLLALGGAIRTLRKERGVSQEDLALLTQIDRSYMGSIERGDQNVGVMHLVRIAEALEQRREHHGRGGHLDAVWGLRPQGLQGVLSPPAPASATAR